MGGEVFVGVRRRDGSEHLSFRWTNCMPYWFRDPDFFEDGPGMDKFISEARPRNSWPKAVPARQVDPSEYGVILIDFPDRMVLSRQGYCTVGVNRLSEISDADEFTGFLTLYETGMIREVYTDFFLRGNPLPKDEIARLADMCRKFVQAGCVPDRFQFSYRFQPGVLVVDSGGESASRCWPEVKQWLKERGWKSKVRRSPPRE